MASLGTPVGFTGRPSQGLDAVLHGGELPLHRHSCLNNPTVILAESERGRTKFRDLKVVLQASSPPAWMALVAHCVKNVARVLPGEGGRSPHLPRPTQTQQNHPLQILRQTPYSLTQTGRGFLLRFNLVRKFICVCDPCGFGVGPEPRRLTVGDTCAPGATKLPITCRFKSIPMVASSGHPSFT